jgi:hypothetical protein
MSKTKVNPGLAAVMIVASMFAGWQTLLIVSVLLLLFCELDEKVKNIMVRVITFSAGLALFIMCWGLIVEGIKLIPSTLNSCVDFINSFLSVGDKIDATTLQTKLCGPINTAVNAVDNIVSFLITLAKFAFIVALIGGKKAKDNAISTKINGYVTKFVNYVNSTDSNNTNNGQMGQM